MTGETEMPVQPLTFAQATELRAVASDLSGYMEAQTGDYQSRIELQAMGLIEADGSAEWFATMKGDAWVSAHPEVEGDNNGQ